MTCLCVLRHAQLFATPWAIAHQAPLSVGLSRQECRNGLPLISPGDLPNTGIETVFLESLALAGGFFTTIPAGKSSYAHY